MGRRRIVQNKDSVRVIRCSNNKDLESAKSSVATSTQTRSLELGEETGGEEGRSGVSPSLMEPNGRA